MPIDLYDISQPVPSDIATHNQFIDGQQLQTQQYLQDLNLWSKNQKMTISQEKTKAMIFNFTEKYQFSTRLQLNNQNIEIVPCKLSPLDSGFDF